ncbi:MAG: ASPIC/UnbV domain-containing protein, partial [Acidobacteriota bacterium]
GGSSLQQEIGLGAATGIEVIEVRWPATGEVQVFRDVAMDRVYRIVEGDPALVPEKVRVITFQGSR